MQELHSAAAAGGRFFGGGGVGDRRLRPQSHLQNNQQALKCPRCDSINTKFCYYNNYNLSQPRHFCKNCRRYWTKGGVLRNVPIGGGCRKSKRSNNNKSKNNNSHSYSSETAPPTTTPTPQPQLPERNSNSHSSSESSSLTAVAVATATEAISPPPPTSNAALNNKLFLHENANNPNLELEQGGGGGGGVFSEIGTFTSLMTSTNEALSFGFGNNGSFIDGTSFRFGGAQSGSDQLPAVPGGGECEWQQQKVLAIGGDDHHTHQEFASGPFLLNQTVPVELSSLQNGKTGHGGCGPLDWQHAAGGGADQGWFDLTNPVDQAYWTHSHWSDQDNPPLFHLP